MKPVKNVISNTGIPTKTVPKPRRARKRAAISHPLTDTLMRSHFPSALFCSLLMFASACTAPAPAPSKPSAPAQASAAEAEYRPTATIKDLMDAEVDYNSD